MNARDAASAHAPAQPSAPLPVAAAQPPVHGTVIGELVSLADGGSTPFVRHGTAGSPPLAARTIVDLRAAAPGAAVVLSFDGGDATRPIVMGLVQAFTAAGAGPAETVAPAAPALRHGRVLSVGDDGAVSVSAPGDAQPIACRVLQTGVAPPVLNAGDEVMLWQAPGTRAVVLGRVGAAAADEPVLPAGALAERPPTLVLEAQGDIVLRNAHARIKLGADGDIEIVGASLTSRTQRLLRLLAPLIKMN